MKLPNLIIVGVQKAGTTTLHDILSNHEEIYSLDSLKDIDIFGKYFIEGSWLEKLQIRIPTNIKSKYILHSHVNYILYDYSLKKIRENCDDAKIILITRDPVERAISAYKYFVRRKRETRTAQEALIYNPLPLEKIVDINQNNNDFTYIEHGFYKGQIMRLESIFPIENIKIISFDDLKNDSRSVVNSITDWLGLETLQAVDLKPKNMGGEVRFLWLNNILFKPSKVKKNILNFVRIFLPSLWLGNIKERVYQKNVKRNSKNKPDDFDWLKIREKLKIIYENEDIAH